MLQTLNIYIDKFLSQNIWELQNYDLESAYI